MDSKDTDKRPKARTPLQKAAQIISDILSPLLVPTYCMAMAMWITPLQVLPERTRLGSTLGVAFITAIVPLMLLLALLRLGRVSDFCLSDRRQRTLPMAVAALAYAAAGFYLTVLHAPHWLVGFFCGASIATLIAMIVNVWWKISAHSIAMGGMAGMMLWFAVARLATVDAIIWLTAVVMLGGIVASARLVLERHTLAQVAAGWLCGAVCVYFTIFIYC